MERKGGPTINCKGFTFTFSALPEGTVKATAAYTPALTDILLDHGAEGRNNAAEVIDHSPIPTLLGELVENQMVESMDPGTQVIIGDAQILITDNFTRNGLIQVIDTVILPPGS